MNHIALLLMLTIAIGIGWFLGRRDKKKYQVTHALPPMPRDYWLGLNYLLDEQHDQAIEMFVKALAEDDQAIETHLALGSLFRRRGEVDKAITIHEKILEKVNLNEDYFLRVQLELARDYFKAGLLDRAEDILQKIALTPKSIKYVALEDLVVIYQQQKDWHQAILVAEQLAQQPQYEKYTILIAHFYCELATKALTKNDYLVARAHIKEALRWDAKSVRSSLLLGQLEYQLGNYEEAIIVYKQIEKQDPVFLPESIPLIVQCFDHLQHEKELLDYLKLCLQKNTAPSIMQLFVERLRKQSGDHVAAEFVAHQLKSNPSVKGLQQLLELHVDHAEGNTLESLNVLRQLTLQLSENKPKYCCKHCGFSGKKLHWVCPTCKQWGTVKPLQGIEGDKH